MTKIALIYIILVLLGLKTGFFGRLGKLSNIIFPTKEWSKYPLKARIKVLLKLGK